MPSPIAHIALGFAAYRLFEPYLLDNPKATKRAHRGILAVAIGLSLLPDLDFLPGVLLGNIEEWHNGATHSPAAAFLAAFAGAAVARVSLRRRGKAWFLFVFAAYGLHVVADFFTYSRGTMLLWPLSVERFSPPVHLFYGLRRSQGELTTHHLVTLATELLFVAALVGLLQLMAYLQSRRLPQAVAADRETQR